VVGIVITGVFILILFIREKKLQKKAAKQKESEE
jgi:sortase A